MSNMEARSFLESVSGYTNSGGPQSSADRPVRLATIDPYYTSGLPQVQFDGESKLTTKGYTWVAGYTPVANDRVYLMPVGQTWIIGGKIKTALDYNQWITLGLMNGWQSFDEANYNTLKVTRTATGLVKLTGMIRNGTTAAGTSVSWLPPKFRPLVNQSFMIISNGVAAGVDIGTDGYIKTGINWQGGGAYTSFDNVAYNNDTMLAWQTPTFANGWSEYSPQLAVGYTKDAMGRVWHRGAIKHGGTPTQEAAVYNVAAGYRSYRQHHMTAYSASGFGNLDSMDTGDIRYKVNGGNAAYIYVNNINYHEASVGTWTNMSLINGWANNAPGQPDASYYKDSEGIVYLRGLIRSGAIGSTCAVLPVGYRPAKILLRAQVTVNAIGRLDIETNGSIVPVSGSNTWYSLDGIQFSAEQ